MKTHKVVLLTLIVSAVLSVSAQAGDHRGNGKSQGDADPAPATRGASSFRSGSGIARFGGGRMISPSQRFSSYRTRSTQSALGPYSVRSNKVVPFGQRRFASGTLRQGNTLARTGNSGRNLGISRNNNHVRSVGNGNRGRGGGNNYLFARHSGNWHRDWDRHHDHWWHGHRCRFVNGYWFIFDLGFSPWYGYPYDYYAYDYYEPDPYAYDSGGYQGDVTYGDQGVYDSSNQYTDSDVAPQDQDSKNVYNSSDQGGESPVAAAQERLARQGYYNGAIDGVFGPETQRAIMRFQSNKGLRSTGYLTSDTLQALGLRQAPATE